MSIKTTTFRHLPLDTRFTYKGKVYIKVGIGIAVPQEKVVGIKPKARVSYEDDPYDIYRPPYTYEA